MSAPSAILPPDWWAELLPDRPHAKPPGLRPMLRLLAYDIADPRRLHRVALWCEAHATRVQRSLYETWLEDPEFEIFWQKLSALVDSAEDRVVAYEIHAAGTRSRRTLGTSMVCTERIVCYFV